MAEKASFSLVGFGKRQLWVLLIERLKARDEFSHLVGMPASPGTSSWSSGGQEPDCRPEQAAACLPACLPLAAPSAAGMCCEGRSCTCSGLLFLFGLRDSDPESLRLIQQDPLGLSVPPCDLRPASSPAPPALLSIFIHPKCAPGLFSPLTPALLLPPLPYFKCLPRLSLRRSHVPGGHWCFGFGSPVGRVQKVPGSIWVSRSRSFFPGVDGGAEGQASL